MFRVVLLIFMTLMLGWFLPAHTRGQISFGPKHDAKSCCAAPEGGPTAPTEEQKRNCAVCFWAAGLLPILPVDFSILYLERHHEQLAHLATQCRTIHLPHESLPRGPPALS